ncbi:MAG: hypothetical protein HY235_19735 [Acidobacteria bacterium]|nr:hypothetical protein [Acidobacteriota bacterium]
MKNQTIRVLRSGRRGLVLGLLAVSLAAQEQTTKPPIDTSQFTASERALLEYLRLDWAKQYRTTGLGVAAKVTHTKLSDGSRLRLARFLEAHRAGFTAPARHGVTTIALTAEEKLIARAILFHEIQHQGVAKLEDIGRQVGISPRSLQQPLRFLEDFGAIAVESDGKESGYRVASRYSRRPTYRIDFFSHQVEVNGRDKFEVA